MTKALTLDEARRILRITPAGRSALSISKEG